MTSTASSTSPRTRKSRKRALPQSTIAAANVDEDLDYRIAQRTKSTEGWRSFLAAHPAGLHAQSARSELDKLVSVEKPPALVAAQGSLSDIKTPSEDTSSDQPVASDEICKRDEDGLERLSHSPTSDEAMRFLTELRCEKLRPELFRLTEHLDYQAPTAADLAPFAACDLEITRQVSPPCVQKMADLAPKIK